jgi:hypothetical protein
MKTPNDRQKNKRKPYEKPTVTTLTPEQAKPKLLAHAMKGDEGARELLELIFPNAPSTDYTNSKNAS